MNVIKGREHSWGFWFLVPLYPYRHRRTFRREVVPETLWTFDQLQGVLYTVVPIRMTVIKLTTGGLLVYAPIAPTQECIRMVQELEAKHGAVRYILCQRPPDLSTRSLCLPLLVAFLMPKSL